MKRLLLTVAFAATSAILPAIGQDSRTALLGTAVPTAQGQRTITIQPDTRWVNVHAGESIRFVIGNTEFGWRFDGSPLRAVDLAKIAPSNAVSKSVMIYVAPTPGHPP